MLPKYTYFKLHDPAAYKYNSTLEYRRDLVKKQITLCKNNINTVNLESQKIRDKLESSITPAQLHELDNRLSVTKVITNINLPFKKSSTTSTKAIY